VVAAIQFAGARLCTLRNERGLSREQLGDNLDPPVDRATIGHWETGARVPRVPALCALVVALDCEIGDLFVVTKNGRKR
jgi:transcriptional regulator with XRE-family HTH domain